MFIWENLAVFPIPKAGCTSIQKAIQSTGKQSKMVSKLEPGELDGKKCYTLTRHPADRLVSFYLNKIKKGDQIEKGQNHEDFDFHINMPFNEMVEVVCNTSDDVANRHFRQQTALLTVDGEFLPTHSWHMENITAFWEAVQKEVDVPNLEHRRRTPGRKPYKKYFTDETKEMVRQRYKDDLEVFRYGF